MVEIGAQASRFFKQSSSISKYQFHSSRCSTGQQSQVDRPYLKTQFSDESKPKSRSSNNFHPGFLNLDQIRKQQKKEHSKQVAEKYIMVMREAIDKRVSSRKLHQFKSSIQSGHRLSIEESKELNPDLKETYVKNDLKEDKQVQD